MELRLKNKVALITGGTGGIGKATAELFISEGAKAVIADINDEAGHISEKSLGNNCKYIYTDVSDFNSAINCIDKTLAHFGNIDILINNAGITADAVLQKMTADNFNKVININLNGVYNMCKAVSDIMIKRNYGRIINTSSVVGIYGNYGQLNYAASKSALIGMTKTLAKELGKYNITVNAVAPGFIETPMLNSVPEKVIYNIKERTPLKRLGKPIEIAYLYLFLASDEASFITGTVISADGGLVL